MSMRRRIELQHLSGIVTDTFDARAYPSKQGFSLARVVLTRLRNTPRPDVLHFCSGYRIWHVVIAIVARSVWGIPYVVSPASAFCDGSLARETTRKRAFIALVDRPFLTFASAVVCRTPMEVAEVARNVTPRMKATTIPNAVKPGVPASPRPRSSGRPTLICLCRFDIWQKGLDRLERLARLMPDVDFVMYGDVDVNAPEATRALKEAAPDNFVMKPPVFGEDKDEVLVSATGYVQLSRFESLSNSVLDALAVGLPVVVSSYISAELEADPGSLLTLTDDDDVVNAQLLGALLADEEAMSIMGKLGQAFVLRKYDADAISTEFRELYTSISRVATV